MSTDSTYDFASPSAPAPPQAPAAPPSPLPETTCPHCGYRIRGKPRHNRCPDCRGQLDAAAADLLQFSPIPRLRLLTVGALVTALAVLAHLAAAVVAGYFLHWRLATGLHAGAAAVAFVGICLVTSSAAPRPADMLVRLFARSFALTAAVMWTATAVVASPLNLRWLTVPALLAMAGAAVTLGLAAGKLAARIPHDGLTHQFRNFTLLLPPYFAILILFQYVDPIPYYLYFFISFPVLGALGGMTLWVAMTLLRLAWELQATIQAARSTSRKLASNRPSPASEPPETPS